ncbi:TPA: TetR/AcrR family transcriptional regulator [Stenotrophomonas maltophilia]|nr:TetR/AcrR family transcriptional regulator [Stenotrophomonas maltophilia]
MALGTREALVQTGESLMRTKGYAAFSYADLADTVGIRKASIHHHFPTKEDLGTAIVEEYVERVRNDFAVIERSNATALGRVEGFVKAFQASATGGVLPLCGALAAEMSALPTGLQQLTHRFFDMQLDWLESVFDAGIEAGEFSRGSGARPKAHALLSLLEGSSFIGWATQSAGTLDERLILRVIQEA